MLSNILFCELPVSPLLRKTLGYAWCATRHRIHRLQVQHNRLAKRRYVYAGQCPSSNLLINFRLFPTTVVVREFFNVHCHGKTQPTDYKCPIAGYILHVFIVMKTSLSRKKKSPLSSFSLKMSLRDIKRSSSWRQSDPNLVSNRDGAKMAGVGE